jgi:hypothetical protein
MQAPAQPRLVACPTLAARLELFLELTHLHRKEVLVDRLHRRRLHGRKSAATKAAADAKLAAFLAAKYGGQSKFAAQALASSTAGPSASTDDVEVLGEMTWAERDAELRSEAVDCDAD